MNKTDFIEILEAKKNAIMSSKIPKNINGNLGKISIFNFLVREYLNFLLNALEFPSLLGIKERINCDYPYLSWIEYFIENTTLNKNHTEFHGFKGFIFRTKIRGEIKINSETDLEDYLQEAKQMIERLHLQILHFLKIHKSEDLTFISTKTNNIEEKITFNVKEQTLIYKGELLKKLTTKKLPSIIFNLAFNGKTDRWAIPIAELIQEGFNSDDVTKGIKNLKNHLLRKLKKPTNSPSLLNDFLIRKPTNIIELSRVFIKI